MSAVLFFLIFWAITFAGSAYGVCYAMGYDRSIPLAVMLGLAPTLPGLLILGRLSNAKANQAAAKAEPEQFQKRPVYVPPPPK